MEIRRFLAHRWTKRSGLTAFVGLIILGGMLLPGWKQRPEVGQPVQFNHAIHARYNTTCDICHQGFSSGAAAGRPHAGICMECHVPGEDPLGTSAAEQELRRYLAAGKDIPWKRLIALPPDVRFSHALHVNHGVSCERCHGAVGSSETPPSRPLKLFIMEECMKCHEAAGASNDCLACHR